ncbi:hypothetical protein Tco_1522235 [Tanacetum coccineum]
MYTFSPMMVANSRKHHCRVRPYTREVLVISTNLDKQKNHYPLDFRNRRGDEARIKNTWYNQGLVCSFMLCDLDFKPLSLSLSSLPSCDLLFLTNMLILLHYLESFKSEFAESFGEVVSSIPGIVDAYLANKMHEAVKTAVQLQSKSLRDKAQPENADFLNKLDDNIKKIIKDQVKEQVKAQVSKILPKIEKTVNEQLEAEVMTRSSTESKTSLAIAANLSELELKKILIDKMESNKSIHRSDEQKNLYKALVDAYESDKLILDTYGDTCLFKRHRDDEDKDEEPSAGSNRGSKRRRAGKEPESTNEPKEKTSKTSGKSYEGSKSKHKTAGKTAQTEEPMHTTKDLEEPAHQEFETGVTKD